eukprot:681852-Pleurochrysis_carterae.AAC.2
MTNILLECGPRPARIARLITGYSNALHDGGRHQDQLARPGVEGARAAPSAQAHVAAGANRKKKFDGRLHGTVSPAGAAT